ncbi:hypothetical protein KAT82_09680, partial [bacterium]|nr:hypothetical protein [bacterium]
MSRPPRTSAPNSLAGEFNGGVVIDGKLGVSVHGSSETVRATASGTGTCGWFEITNGTNSNSAVYATSDGNGYAVRGTMTGSVLVIDPENAGDLLTTSATPGGAHLFLDLDPDTAIYLYRFLM